jgi:hypothetical protein
MPLYWHQQQQKTIGPFFQIKVKWFPYDKQDCRMKFGAWSYTGNYVDLHLIRHNDRGEKDEHSSAMQQQQEHEEQEEEYMEMGMDLSFFYKLP